MLSKEEMRFDDYLCEIMSEIDRRFDIIGSRLDSLISYHIDQFELDFAYNISPKCSVNGLIENGKIRWFS